MEALLGELLCPVCLDFYTCPIILPCSHVLCRSPCAERLFVRDFVRCPVCRDNSFVTGGLQNLPRVLSLENIIERYRAPAIEAPQEEAVNPEDICGPDDIPCQLCQEDPVKKATRSCLKCNASYCQKCLSLSHPDREPFNQHELVQPKRYARPKELRCPKHEGLVSIWCQTCQVLGCLFCADDPQTHQGHKVMTLDQACVMYKGFLEDNLKKLSVDQNLIQLTISRSEERRDAFLVSVREKQEQINNQCDNLIAEIEIKRDFFLSDLQYEKRSKGEMLNHIITGFTEQQTHIQNLVHYTQEVLKEADKRAFLQLGKLANEKARKQPLTQGDSREDVSSSIALHHKVLDMRKERAVLRDMNYLRVPDQPVIDVEKCSRSVHSVVLVLSAPNQEYEVLDGYKVYYNKNRDSPIEEWDLLEFTTPQEERKVGRAPPCSNSVCLINNDLDSSSVYHFTVKAYNAAGESDMSAVTSCTTLSESQSVLRVPEIIENMCHTYSHSIQIHSPSPQEVVGSEAISHYMLYREATANKIWKSISLVGRVDHRVFGLESDELYDFVVMACNSNGECQVSNMVTYRTETAAF